MEYKPLHRRMDGGTAFVLGDPRIDQQGIVVETDYTGQTDAAPDINDAVALGSSLGKIVYLKPGAVRLHSAIIPRANTGLVGAGMKATKLLPHGQESAVGTSGNPYGAPNDWQMRDFEIDGVNAVRVGNGVTVKGAYFTHARRVSVERLIIRNTHGTGLGIDQITGSIRDVWAINCGSGSKSDSETTPGHSGIGIGCGFLDPDWEPLTIESCHAEGSRRFGIFVESQTPGLTPSGLTVVGCTATGCQDGFGIAGPSGMRLVGNHSYANRRSGVAIDRGTMAGMYSLGALVQSNHVHGNQVGIIVDVDATQPMAHHLVVDNQVHSNTGHGIRVSAAAAGTGERRYVKVAGNDVHGNGSHGIALVERAGASATSSLPFTRFTIENNRMWNNTGSAIRVAHPTSGLVGRGNQAWDDQAVSTQTKGWDFDTALTHSTPMVESDLMGPTNTLPA